jgi:hypothetical protein
MEALPMTITLHIEVTGLIVAEHSGNGSERISELFNTSRLPTPFTFDRVTDVENFGARVITQIRKLIPTDTVAWSAERCEEFTAFKFLQASKAGR